jgi:RNA polymerase sigma-70 factor (ECF subfamily)
MNEKLLIQEAKSGAANSFEKLVALHQLSLYKFLLARCESKYDAEDVLQDTFISAYKYLDSYHEQWKFNTWLFTIAKRLIKNQDKYYDNSHLELDEGLVESHDSNSNHHIYRDNIWIQIKKLIKENDFDALWLFYIEQMSLKEISQVLNKTQSWVKISLFRSKKKLSLNRNIQELFEEVCFKV